MNKCSVTRVVAAVVLASLLGAFALPAAAAPGSVLGTDGSWTPATFLHWVQSVWTGWLGSGGEVTEPSGIGNVHDQLKNALDPDGREVAGAGTDSGTGAGPRGGSASGQG